MRSHSLNKYLFCVIFFIANICSAGSGLNNAVFNGDFALGVAGWKTLGDKNKTANIDVVEQVVEERVPLLSSQVL